MTDIDANGKLGWFGRMREQRRARRTNCSDCPIVMRCGLEPQKDCLGRIEALARGDRRQPGAWDTCITGLIARR